jgi:hypothetical protein
VNRVAFVVEFTITVMNDAGDKIFLLGGHDLEMIEIENILKNYKCKYIDFNLKWGAGLSAYRQNFDNENVFYGIELIKDCEPPDHYFEIDHHNEKSHLPSSIEQVAVLLKLELDRWQRLVAANDSLYIPGMLQMNATQDEIKLIRELDRKAQGVTENDEILGDKSIRENLVKEKDLILVKSLTHKFSTITDRLYPFRKLLIYTDRELTYYGEGVLQLADSYHDLNNQNLAFSGGGENGFFGIKKEGLNSNKAIKKEVEKIKSIILNEQKYAV